MADQNPQKYRSRLYGPSHDNNPMNRDILYPETDAESVLMPTGNFLKDDIGPNIAFGGNFTQPTGAYRETLFLKIDTTTTKIED